MSSPHPQSGVDLLTLGAGKRPSDDPVLLGIQPDSGGRDPGQWGGRPDPQSGADDLAGVSPSTRYDPAATPHIAPPPDGWDDDDWGDDGVEVGTPGTCWVCGSDFDDSIGDFEPSGPHSACAAEARRMDAAFREQRRRRSEAAAGWYFNAWTVQW